MTATTSVPDVSTESSTATFTVRRAAVYFAVVYFSQGVCQAVTLLNQPLRMFLRETAGFDAQRIAHFYFVITIPWMIKPAYGLLSDFVPLFGYRRKSYLLLLNLLAAASFFLIVGMRTSTDLLLIMLTLTGMGVAASDVVVDAMMVQAGRETGRTRLFQGVQWFSLNLAAIGSGIAASFICSRYADDAPAALRTAAVIAGCVPFIVATLTWMLVRDQRARIDLPELRATTRALLHALRSGQLWLVILFLFLTNFNPGIQTPLYDFLAKNAGMTAANLAVFDTVFSAGNVVGALVFTLAMSGKHMSTKRAVSIGLIVGAAGLLPLLLVSSQTSALIASGIFGVSYMIATLSQLSVAAEACPRRVEAAVFATLMSINNLSMQWSDVVGSRFYDGALHGRLAPLILASAALTAAGLMFVPFLKPVKEPQSS